MEPVTLTTDRLHLRAFAAGDIDAVHAACQDPEIPRFTSVPDPYTREDAATFVHEVCPAGWREDSLYNFGVFTRDEDLLVGSMGLVRLAQLAPPQRQAEIGYWTVKEQRGRGYTVEAARAVADWALDDLGVHRLEWYADTANPGSRAVAEHIGVTVEGVLRGKIAHRGERHDSWVGALLHTDPRPWRQG